MEEVPKETETREHKRNSDKETYRHVRMTNDSNGISISSLPVYARVAERIGIPSILAVVLVYLLFQVIPTLQKTIDAHVLQTSNNYELYKQILEKESENYRMLQRICVRESKTDAERNGCFDK